jgi:tripartite-type tricarboxylate transporter receptor subunit TctC
MPTRRVMLGAAIAAASAVPVRLSQAQAWPSRPIRFIVPYTPGGSTDITARLYGNALAATLAQQILVENRAGGGGNIGMEAAAQSPPDGYTFVVATSAHAINMTLFRNPGYDIRRSFAPIALLSENPLLLVANPDLPARTVAELIALAKQRPLNYASSGNGQSTHMAAALFCSMAGVAMTHVPYRGSAPAIADVIGGAAQIIFDSAPSALPHVQAGRLRPLGVTTRTRFAALPDLPTIAEAGLPGYDVAAWNGLLAPAGTAAAVIARMHGALMAAIADPGFQDRFAALGATVRPTASQEFGDFIEADIERWAGVVRASGAQVD